MKYLRYRKAHPDEKGTERKISSNFVASSPIIARPIPTKRELKEVEIVGRLVLQYQIARPIPTKRELKVFFLTLGTKFLFLIARPIPTKRELKAPHLLAGTPQPSRDRKAHPDEKGTESCFPRKRELLQLYRKAHPDEKGTESHGYTVPDDRMRALIARPIPTKRELKVAELSSTSTCMV